MIIMMIIVIVTASVARLPPRCSVQSSALGEHKPGRIKLGRVKRAALSLQNRNFVVFFYTTPFILLYYFIV